MSELLCIAFDRPLRPVLAIRNASRLNRRIRSPKARGWCRTPLTPKVAPHMVLRTVRPLVLPHVSAGGVVSVRRFHVRPGDEVAIGSPLLDYVVDLSVAAPQDCAPIFHMRLLSNEAGRVSELRARPGEVFEPGMVLAFVDDSPTQEEAGRPLRTSSIGIEYDPIFDE